MKIFLSGVKRSFGIGKESKAAFDIYDAFVLAPVETGKFGNMTVEGGGFVGSKMRIHADAFKSVAALRLPGVYDLECEQRLIREELVTTIIGVIPEKLKAA